jgi:hypothetical protein
MKSYWSGRRNISRSSKSVMYTKTLMWMKASVWCLSAACFAWIAPFSLLAQGRAGEEADLPTARAAAPIDLTGYWVSLVTEDWRFRMFVPPKGDYTGVPLNAAARKIADAWDPAKDEASGNQCKSFGAANIMRVPGRIHITWQDDETLKLETDAGMQTRIFYFATPKSQGGDWQGVSKASWDFMPAAITSVLGNRFRKDTRFGSLKVVTTKLKPGYLRTNGVPYSSEATVTEYFDRVTQPNGQPLLIVTTTVEDPVYLRSPFLTSVHFEKEADASGWHPTPCTSR